MYGEISERFCVKLVTRRLPLDSPEVRVGVEDSSAKEVVEEEGEPLAFRVVVEVGLKHVLHVHGVRRHDAENSPGTSDDAGVGGTRGEDFGGPFEESVVVLAESRKHSDDRVDFEARFAGFL